MGWLFFDYVAGDEEGAGEELVIETSWLPADVASLLWPFGFQRRKDGAYRLVCGRAGIDDRMGVVRALHRALEVLLREQIYGRNG